MVINSRGEVIHSDADSPLIGTNMIFTDISYSGDQMISVTVKSEDGRMRQFTIPGDDL